MVPVVQFNSNSNAETVVCFYGFCVMVCMVSGIGCNAVCAPGFLERWRSRPTKFEYSDIFLKKIVWIFRHVEWMHMNSQNLSFDLLRQVEIENECPHIYLIMQV